MTNGIILPIVPFFCEAAYNNSFARAGFKIRILCSFIQNWYKAISLNPNYANAYINRGLAYYRQGNSKGAIANYNKAIELAPSNAIAYNNRALAYTRLGNQQAAQADKRKAAILSQRQSQ